jgi:hypothetical protein
VLAAEDAAAATADAGFAPSLVAGDSSLLHAARLSKSRPLAKLSKRFGVMVLSID